MPKSFYDCEIGLRGHSVHKIKAKDTTGRWAYYFVLMEGNNERIFLNALKSGGIIDINSYGTVIGSCYGEEPNEELKIFLMERYNFIV